MPKMYVFSYQPQRVLSTQLMTARQSFMIYYNWWSFTNLMEAVCPQGLGAKILFIWNDSRFFPRLKHYIVNTDNFTNGGVGGQEKTKHCLDEAQNIHEDGETTETGDSQNGDRAASPDSVKMTSSTSDASEAEVDSAMSQVSIFIGENKKSLNKY